MKLLLIHLVKHIHAHEKSSKHSRIAYKAKHPLFFVGEKILTDDQPGNIAKQSINTRIDKQKDTVFMLLVNI